MATFLAATASANQYTQESLEGAGALKGAPATIQSILAIDGGNRVVFAWKDNGGNTHISNLDVNDAFGIAKLNGFSGTTAEWLESLVGPVGPQGGKGDKGDKGDRGEKGDKGDTGAQGPRGADGVQGQKGDKGDTGERGVQGAQGPPGEPGIQGPAGERGPQGATGPAGSDGSQGAQGPAGPKGERGDPFLIHKIYETESAMQSGYDSDGLPEGALVGVSSATGGESGGKIFIKGASAYEFFYNLGDVEGLAGPQGEPGPQGPKGEQGPVGPQGPEGPQGPQGIQGPEGPQGAKGDQGEQGIQGKTGAPGPEGPQGPQGPEGKQGIQGIQGPPGEQGPVGPAGPAGPTGPKGDPGEKGDLGPAPNIQVGTVTTLEPDQDAYVVRQPGSPDEAPVFDFGIPKGDSGISVLPMLRVTTIPAVAGVSLTVSRGTKSFTGVTDEQGQAELAVSSFGDWEVSAVYNGESYETLVHVDSVSIFEAKIQIAHILGAEWDGGPGTAWTRTDGAALFTDPVPYVAGMGQYGSPFDDIMPWAGMTVEERTGGTMVKIPKFWYKLESFGNGGLKLQIVDKAIPGFFVSPAHMDRGDGKGERDAVYVGRYHCRASDYKSVSGSLPNDQTTRSAARASIHNLGKNIWQCDFAMRFTIWLLFLVEFADWDSQSVIGYGCGNNSSLVSAGYTDSMPFHTGTMMGSRTAYGNGTQYRNIEGLWDNAYDWMDGCYYNAEGLHIIMNPSMFSDNAGGITVGITPSKGNPSKFSISGAVGFPLFYPIETKTGNNGIKDCWETEAGKPCLFAGGSFTQSPVMGLFTVRGLAEYRTFGARLQELP